MMTIACVGGVSVRLDVLALRMPRRRIVERPKLCEGILKNSPSVATQCIPLAEEEVERLVFLDKTAGVTIRCQSARNLYPLRFTAPEGHPGASSLLSLLRIASGGSRNALGWKK